MSLEQLRSEIDELDDRLLSLLNERAVMAQDIGRAKVESKVPVREADREERVIARILMMNQGPLDDDEVDGIYRQVISACVSVQERRIDT